MTTNLQIKGTQFFMDQEIPIVLGGFGSDKRCISDKTIAEIHNMREPDVRRRITDNIIRFRENVDFIDMKEGVYEAHTLDLLLSLGYNKSAVTQAEHIYLLSERGYAKLIKIMDTDLAWEIHDKLIDEYFELRANFSELSPELRLLVNLERQQKNQEKQIADTNRKLDGIRDVVSLNTQSWREEARRLIVRIAQKMGGNDYIREVNAEVFHLVDQRGGVSLETRLTNKRRRMADEGVCKSKRDKLSKVDVISDDKKLIEIYVSIVKEMAVKYGVWDAKKESAAEYPQVGEDLKKTGEES